MKRYKPTLKDTLIQHHTEKDVLKFTFVFGKNHNHLEINEGELVRDFISNKRADLFKFAKGLINEYAKMKRIKNVLQISRKAKKYRRSKK